MEEKFPSYQSCENGKEPQKHLQESPASSFRVFICYKGETITNNNDIGFCLAVRYGVLSKD